MTQVQMTHVSHFEHWDFGFICDFGAWIFGIFEAWGIVPSRVSKELKCKRHS
jgi:hypothetical protein